MFLSGKRQSPRVGVVIPNWNGKHWLQPCLDSLSQQYFKDFSIIVVDNNSSDGSVEFLSKRWPDIDIIKNQSNLGFSAAVNAGILRSGSDYIFLLNNDTQVHPGCLKEIVETLDQKTEIGFCATKMLLISDHSIIDAVGDSYERNGRARNIGQGEDDIGQYSEEKLVFGACAGAAVYRRSLFDEVGLFDEDYFAYYEDIDFSFRAQLAGYKCLFLPSAVVYHARGATKGHRSAFVGYHGSKNLLNTLVKNMPTALLIKYMPAIIWYQIKTLGSFIFGFKYGLSNLQGKFGALRQLPKMLKKRYEIQRRAKVSSRYIDSIIKR